MLAGRDGCRTRADPAENVSACENAEHAVGGGCMDTGVEMKFEVVRRRPGVAVFAHSSDSRRRA